MPDLGRRVLILVPHPDDEVVGCAAAIGRARRMGCEFFALYLSTGVPAADRLWPWQRRGHAGRVARRRGEALRAASALSIAPAGFLDAPSRTLKDRLPEARAAARAAVRGVAADALWAPAYEGGHQDHDAANALASTFRGSLRLIEFAEYNFAGGRVRSNQFPASRGDEWRLTLSAAERNFKGRLLAIYRSERSNLAHVERTAEALRPLATHDYGRPPHAGRLFYERFHWVPFAHPRIDSTPSAIVCRTIRTGLTAMEDDAPSP